MVSAMVLAHLVGDYVLQWDALAAWKSRALKGVLVHSLIVFIVTWLFALPFAPGWWSGILFIGLAHTFIDAVQLYVRPPIPPLLRFTLDQVAHFVVIFAALAAGGFLPVADLPAGFAMLAHSERLMLILLAYAFVTMPAWVIVKFTVYGLIQGGPPAFPGLTNKYVEILERMLITTFVALGQFFLVPLVVAPRLIISKSLMVAEDTSTIYLGELLASVTLAVTVGLFLRQL